MNTPDKRVGKINFSNKVKILNVNILYLNFCRYIQSNGLQDLFIFKG